MSEDYGTSPDDGITIDDYYKTMAYAYLYKALGKTVDEIKADQLTVTMVRDVHPDTLFAKIRENGGVTEEQYCLSIEKIHFQDTFSCLSFVKFHF